MKKLLAFALTICMLFSLTGCNLVADLSDSVNNTTPTEKTFDFDGLSIDLNTDFLRMEFIDDSFDFIVGDGDVTVMGIKVPFEGEDYSNITALDYAELFRDALTENAPTEVTSVSDIPQFEYATAQDDGAEQTNMVTVFKAEDCFWVVQFAFLSGDANDLRPLAQSYAETIEV